MAGVSHGTHSSALAGAAPNAASAPAAATITPMRLVFPIASSFAVEGRQYERGKLPAPRLRVKVGVTKGPREEAGHAARPLRMCELDQGAYVASPSQYLTVTAPPGV